MTKLLALIGFLSISMTVSSAFAADIATMFGCESEADSKGQYYSVQVATRDFVDLNVSIYLMKGKGAKSEQLNYEADIVAKKGKEKQIHSIYRMTYGYEFNSEEFGKAIVFVSKYDFEDLIADRTGKVHGEIDSHLKIGGELLNTTCSY